MRFADELGGVPGGPHDPAPRAPVRAMTALRCNVADLLYRSAARRRLHLEADAGGMVGIGGTRLDDTTPLVLDAVLERVPDGVVVRGSITTRYVAQCSRCLRPIAREVHVGVRELFETHPLDGETYLLRGDEIDLEEPVRDTVLLNLPLVPLCRDDCAGLCPVCGGDRNERPCACDATLPDPRWEPLRDLMREP